MQSSFCLGMTVLSMAIAPKVLEAFGAVVDSSLLSSFLIYATGFLSNWVFTFILWHHFWFIERVNRLYYLNCQPNEPPDDINLQLRYEANAFS